MRREFRIFAVAAAVFMAAGCIEYDTPENRKKENEKEETQAEAIYNVVAHRGGYMESGLPDCSLAGLKYAISLGCKYSEADIVITKDREVLVIHPVLNSTMGDIVNGLVPSEHSAEEIRNAGRLKNGEVIPTLREYISFLQDKDNNPIGHTVWLDVKQINLRGVTNNELSIDACFRACEIIKEMRAEKIMEFIVPSGDGIYPVVHERVIKTYGINCAWMSAAKPAAYDGGWAQLRYDKLIGSSKVITPEEFFEAGVPLSIYYTVGSSAEDQEIGNLVIPYYPKLKAIFTNYPKALIKQLKDGGYVK